MQIQVIQTTVASKHPCGTKPFLYEAGNVYDIYEDLAEVFLKEGWGEKVEEVKQEIKTQAETKPQQELDKAKEFEAQLKAQAEELQKLKAQAEEDKLKLQEAKAQNEKLQQQLQEAETAKTQNIETQDLSLNIETQDLKLEKKERKNANK